MKKIIELAAYGWRHRHWSSSFYPQDLPMAAEDDWRLSYYSNEFNAVMVPAAYWYQHQHVDCAQWLDAVHDDFHFIIECHASMFQLHSVVEISNCLKILRPQISAVLVLDQFPGDDNQRQLVQLAALLQQDSVAEMQVSVSVSSQEIWLPQAGSGAPVMIIEDNLSDLRANRLMVEQFSAEIDQWHKGEIATSEVVESFIIVSHSQLQTANLAKFRSVLDIMGY